MKNIYVKGYINYENTSYTFSYENKKLTLINIENKQSFFSEYKYVEFFKGFTVDGFDILFYINNDIYYKNGCYICSPRCIIFLRNSEYVHLLHDRICRSSQKSPRDIRRLRLLDRGHWPPLSGTYDRYCPNDDARSSLRVPRVP